MGQVLIKAGLRKVIKRGGLVMLLFLYSFHCLSQKETAIWYFGDRVGLDFNSGRPVELLDGKMLAVEGCSVISDKKGNLLFYTNGVTVYNRNHMPMLNGDGLFGHISSTQSAFIVPDVEVTSRYYIFTVDGITGGGKGLHYSVVDMRLDQGLGAVLSDEKNVVLRKESQEKITAVRHKNNRDIWVVTCSSLKGVNQFYTYLLTEDGVQNPIVSRVNKISSGVGYLKSSPNGEKLVAANSSPDGFYIFDFDSEWGKVSNQQIISGGLVGGFISLDQVYGVEFSPDSSLLYVSNFPDGVYQFNLTSGNQTEIFNSGIPIYQDPEEGHYWGALQLALDGKIYVSLYNSEALSVINNPNVYGLGCNFKPDAVKLISGVSKLGLPQFVPGYFYPGTIQASQVCLGAATTFTQEISTVYDKVLWDFGDGTTSGKINPEHEYKATGEYEVSLTMHIGREVVVEYTKAVVHATPNVRTEISYTQCDDNQDGYAFFNLKILSQDIRLDEQELNISYYHNRSDAEAKRNPIDNTASYENAIAGEEVVFARSENDGGCFRITEIKLQVTTTTIPEDFEVVLYGCDTGEGFGEFDLNALDAEFLALFPKSQDLKIRYFTSQEDAFKERNSIENKTLYVNTNAYIQELWVRVDSRANNSCFGLGKHVKLSVAGEKRSQHAAVVLCAGASVVLDAGSGYNSYLWSTGAHTQAIEVTEPGYYTIAVTNLYWNLSCTDILDFEVISSEPARVQVIAEGWGENNNLVRIEATGEGEYEYSLNGIDFQSEPEFKNIDPSLTRVYIRDKNGCGMVSRDFYVLYYPKFFTPNGDGVNDSWQLGNASKESGNQLQVFDRFGKLICDIGSNDLGWDGTCKGKPMPTDDYWFVLKRQDGKSYKGHFSLKR
ncbi:T9SS type B sorting domain-containing protein [Formosa sp. S-31]|uniref:T9SS type B sorting domain-containing protein n=1 Tax=Formosa sp. S-31 TaxID=2790949 RepID=UPI003EB9AD90